MVQVVVDGVRMVDSALSPVAEWVRGMSLHEIESMEYLTPLQAGTFYGVGGNVSNGVLVIHTRGRGPFRSSARNP